MSRRFLKFSTEEKNFLSQDVKKETEYKTRYKINNFRRFSLA